MSEQITIFQFADLVDKELNIKRYPNQNGRWMAQFEKCEVSDGAFLRGVYGTGVDARTAINDYVRQISGKKLVFNSYTDRRMEIVFPVITINDLP